VPIGERLSKRQSGRFSLFRDLVTYGGKPALDFIRRTPYLNILAQAGPKEALEEKRVLEGLDLFFKPGLLNRGEMGRRLQIMGKRGTEEGSVLGQLLGPELAFPTGAVRVGAGKVVKHMPLLAALPFMIRNQFLRPKIQPAVAKEAMADAVAILKQVKPEQEALTKALKTGGEVKVGLRALEEEKLLGQGLSPLEAFEGSLKVLGGKADRGISEATSKNIRRMGDERIEQLFNIVDEFDYRPTQNLNNKRAFFGLFQMDEIPTQGQLRNLSRIFGDDFVNEATRLRGLGPTAFDTFLDVAGINRAMMTTLDISASVRQAGPLGIGNLKAWTNATGAGIKAVFNPKYERAIVDSMLDDVRFDDVTKVMGVDLTIFGRTATTMEELAGSRFADLFPFVRGSKRGHVVLLNKLRWDVARKWRDELIASGYSMKSDAHIFRNAGKTINILTGRGPAPGGNASLSALLNASVFSYRLQTARILTPALLALPGVRMRVANSMVRWTALGLTSLALADLMFDEVSVNWKHPLSSNWGKIQIGPLKIDPWVGFQQYASLAFRLMQGAVRTEKGVRLERGRLQDRMSLLANFALYKVSPTTGLALMLGRGGESVFGEKVTPSEAARMNLTPLNLQALHDAFVDAARYYGSVDAGLFAGASALVLETGGVTANSYTAYSAALDRAAFETAGVRDYNDITDFQVQQKVKEHPLVLGLLRERDEKLVEHGSSPGDPVDIRVRDHWNDYEASKLLIEMQFAQVLEKGITGETLLQKVKEFKRDSAAQFDLSFSKDERDYMKERRSLSLLNRYRDEYWAIEPEIYYVRGQELENHNVKDEERQKVLRRAEDAGLNPIDITTRGPKDFTYDIVKDAILEYDADMITLRPHFDVPNRVIQDADLLDLYYAGAEAIDLEQQGDPRADDLRLAKKIIADIRLQIRLNSPVIFDAGVKYGKWSPRR